MSIETRVDTFVVLGNLGPVLVESRIVKGRQLFGSTSNERNVAALTLWLDGELADEELYEAIEEE